MIVLLLCCRDAWNTLGDMSKEEAMRHYVDELKKVKSCSATIVEGAMPYVPCALEGMTVLFLL